MSKRNRLTKVYRSSHWTWYATHPWEYVYDLYRDIRMIIERGLYGYARSDVWGLDWYLSSWLPNALHDLADKGMGCPQQLFDGDAIDDQCHKWTKLLKEIAKGFEDYVAWEEANNWSSEYEEKISKGIEKSMKLLGKWFSSLWD